jgi:hypothetical protein
MAISATGQLGWQRLIMPEDRSFQRYFAEEHALSSRGRSALGVLERCNRDYMKDKTRADQLSRYPAEAWDHYASLTRASRESGPLYPILIIEATLGVP